jgi:hypothetical protein
MTWRSPSPSFQSVWLLAMNPAGFPISSSATSGPDRDIAQKSRAMPSIALSRALVAVTLALASCTALAKEAPPRFLQEPVFGLRLEAANAQLDLLPEDERRKCFQLADDEYLKGRQWVFAVAREADVTYYVAAGYFERRHPDKSEPRYRLDTFGGVYRIDGNACLGIGAAREVFDVRPLDETPQAVLQQLAFDLAERVARALGGPDRLRMALKKRNIDPAGLSPELAAAFNTYIGR